jgi:hypothetical protein
MGGGSGAGRVENQRVNSEGLWHRIAEVLQEHDEVH